MCLISSFVIGFFMWLPTSFMKSVEISSECESFNFERVPSDNLTYYVACMEKDTRESPAYKFYMWMRQIIVTFIPILILLVLNTCIIRGYLAVVRKRNDRRNGGNSDGSDIEGQNATSSTPFLKEDHNLIKMLYGIMISFFITMLPPGVANAIYTEFLSTNLEYEIFRAIANVLEISNHAMNFYLYILLSKPLRGAIKEVCLEASHYFGHVTGRTSKTPEGKNDSPTDKEERLEGEIVSKKEESPNSTRPISNISILSGSCNFIEKEGSVGCNNDTKDIISDDVDSA